MLLSRHCWPWLLSLVFLWVIPPVSADDDVDPLRFIPVQADIVAKVENPAEILKSGYDLKIVENFLKIKAVAEFYESTNARRANQLVQYFEKELGADRYELIDQLAGNGIVFAAKAENNPPVVLILQGKNEAITRKFVKLAKTVLESEFARQENPAKIQHKKYNGINAYQLGEAYMAVAGSAIIVSNKKEALKACADKYLGKSDNPSVLKNESLIKARKFLPANPNAWAWVNLETLQKLPGAKNTFQGVDDAKAVHLSPGVGAFAIAGKAPFATAGFYIKEGNRFETVVKMPKGLDGFSKVVAENYYPGKGEGALPLLEPKNVLLSSSYFFDLSSFWKNRKKAMEPEALKAIANLEKLSGRFLLGTKFGQLMEWSGSHQRIVVAEQTRSVYKKKKSQIYIPSFALVHEVSDKKFTTAANRILRTAALIGAAGLDLQMKKIDRNGAKLVSYRFPEDKELENDQQNIRYAFSPTFTWVGNQFVISSTQELAEDLVDELQKEKNPRPGAFTSQTRVYGSGLGLVVKNFEEQLVPLAVLGQAMTPEEARRELRAGIRLLDQLGTLQSDIRYGKNQFEMRFILDME